MLVRGGGGLSFRIAGILEVSKDHPDLFSHNRAQQFTGAEFFDEKMTVIVDTKTALQALETIVDQGEGGIGVPDSHYSIFVELYQRRKEWVCINYIDEPHTAKYKHYELAYRVCQSLCYSFVPAADTVAAILAVARGRCIVLLSSADDRSLLGGGVGGEADAAIPEHPPSHDRDTLAGRARPR